MKRTYPAEPSKLGEIRGFIRERAAQAGFADGDSADLVLAVSEACANAIQHSGTPELEVEWVRRGERIEIEIRDKGVFRRRVPMPEVEGVGGHGIPLMMALVDEIAIIEGTEDRPGTRVRLVVSGPSRSIAC